MTRAENFMKIAIIGAAGTVGSCTTFALVTGKLADEILMIDPSEEALKGHWMDVSRGGAAQGITVRRGNYKDLSGADIAIVAVGAPVNAKASRLELVIDQFTHHQVRGRKHQPDCPRQSSSRKRIRRPAELCDVPVKPGHRPPQIHRLFHE